MSSSNLAIDICNKRSYSVTYTLFGLGLSWLRQSSVNDNWTEGVIYDWDYPLLNGSLMATGFAHGWPTPYLGILHSVRPDAYHISYILYGCSVENPKSDVSDT